MAASNPFSAPFSPQFGGQATVGNLGDNVPAPGPTVHAFAVTPSDSTVFATATRQVWVGVGGAVAVTLAGDTLPVTLAGVKAGTTLDLSVVQVMATNTTATNIVGLY